MVFTATLPSNYNLALSPSLSLSHQHLQESDDHIDDSDNTSVSEGDGSSSELEGVSLQKHQNGPPHV